MVRARRFAPSHVVCCCIYTAHLALRVDDDTAHLPEHRDENVAVAEVRDLPPRVTAADLVGSRQ